MKIFFTFIFFFFSVYINAQTLCGTTSEGGTITLTAPAGNVFTSINFASYGTPNGSCGSFTIGSCHAANSTTICSAVFVGNNSASINATNGVFGDPCGGTFKRLYIEATYSLTLPLTLISFTAKKIEAGKIRLDWLSENEINTSAFIIERSTDGILFEAAGSVPARGISGNSYSFTNTIPGAMSIYYYRLKMVDKDNRYQYSNIVRINNNLADIKLSVFPVPANNFITITSNKQQEAVIINGCGQSIKNILLTGGSQLLNIGKLNSGVYFIKTGDGVMKFIKK